MTSYTDSADRLWLVRVDIDAARRVKAVAGVDLLDGALVGILDAVDDPVTLADVAYGLCLPQAVAAGIDRDAFASGVSGPAIDAAAEAVLSAVFDSFPEPEPAAESDPAHDAPPVNLWRLASQLAARAGVSPGPHTLRELAWAADGRESAEWQRASFVIASVVNADQRRKRRVSPSDVNPYDRVKKKAKRRTGIVETLCQMFVPAGKPA